MRLHCVIYNQFCAPIFKPMLRYAWQKSGYVSERVPCVETFQNVLEVNFTFQDEQCCNDDCETMCFILCAHCRKPLCFKHSFTMGHTHFEVVD